MFPYRGLFLTVTISLTSVVLGDVIVQPGYDHFSKNPYYLQPASHRINSQTEQYHTKQLPNQELQYLQTARTVYPYHESKDYSSNQVGDPYHPFRHGMYSLRHHPHYARIGSHGYSRPSVFVGYRQPSIGHYHWGSPYHHHRYRRSLDSDSTNTESSESANVAHDNDVASKSALTDDKHPKATDSLLPEQEPTDTNDKHVENRQITFDPVTGPRLFGIYPQNIRFPEEPIRENTMQRIMQDPPMLNPSILNFDQKSQKNEQDCTCGNSQLVNNRPFSHVRFPKESSNYDYNSEAASPRWSGNYFGKLLLDNMRHQWAGYHTYTPSYTSPAPKPPTLETLYMNLLRKYELLLQIAKQHGIPIQFLIQERQNEMPFHSQFSSTTDTPITKNEEDASWTPDTIEITRYLEQDLPEYMPLVSDSDQDNYRHHCLNCHKNAPNYSLDDSKDNSDFQKNSNSAYRIEPSISIPNYDLNYAPDIDISVVPDHEIH